MKQWTFLLLVGLAFLLGGCGDDDGICVDLEYDEPTWDETIVTVGTTNTPTVQIDRFVAANNLDTIQTASGLVYTIIETGGSEKPVSTSTVTAWYRGYLTDGELFDQSTVCNGPLNLTLDGLIPAWQEGIPKLGRGGKMLLLARPSLAYENDSPSNGSQVLVFEIELLDFE